MTRTTGTIAALLAAMTIFAATLPAEAISRIRSDQTACSSIQTAVQREGVVVLRYPSTRIAGHFLFDRYVADGGFCRAGQMVEIDTVPAADTPHCPVRRCVRFEPLFDFGGPFD